MVMSPGQRILRAVFAWAVVALFAFPLYFWVTVAFKPDRDVFALPPKLFNFDWSMQSFEEVFGISLGFEKGLEVLPGGGNFYMLPRLWDSIVIAMGSTALAVTIATLAAYALSRMRIRGQHHFVFWVLSTRMMPPVAVAIPMFFIFRDLGLHDTYIGIIIVHALMNLPLAVLLLKSFFDDIPTEIDEAALIDGAGRFKIFWKIVLPMAVGGIAATAVLCFIFSWTEFLFVLTLTQTGIKTVPVVSSTFVTSTGTAWGNMAALGVAAILPAFVFILLVQRNLVRGLTLGSLKQ
ncbi:MAG: carbohydrate ABC transporter permease [Pseudomonadota bacterium]